MNVGETTISTVTIAFSAVVLMVLLTKQSKANKRIKKLEEVIAKQQETIEGLKMMVGDIRAKQKLIELTQEIEKQEQATMEVTEEVIINEEITVQEVCEEEASIELEVVKDNSEEVANEIVVKSTSKKQVINVVEDEALMSEILEAFNKEECRVSISAVRKHFGIGYTRAKRLMDQLEASGAITQDVNGNRLVA